MLAPFRHLNQKLDLNLKINIGGVLFIFVITYFLNDKKMFLFLKKIGLQIDKLLIGLFNETSTG